MRHTDLRGLQASRTLNHHLYIAMGLALLAFLALQGMPQKQATFRPVKLETFPLHIGKWEGTEVGQDQGVTPQGVDDWVLRRYGQNAEVFVWFYIGYYRHHLSATNPHSPLLCYPVNGWTPSQRGLQTISLPSGKTIRINKLLVKKGIEQRLVLYWYQWGENILTGNKLSIEEYGYKLSALWHSLHGSSRSDRVLVRISAPVVDTMEKTLSREIAFLQASWPLLVHHFSLNVTTP